MSGSARVRAARAALALAVAGAVWLTAPSAFAADSGNPILPEDRDRADPSIELFNGRY